MNKEIKDLKDLKIGKKYKLTSTVTNPWVLNGTEYTTKLIDVHKDLGYRFNPIEYEYNIDIKPEHFIQWRVEETESSTEDKSKYTPKAKEDKPLIEMIISGVDHLFSIPLGTTLDKPDDQTEDEKAILNLSLYGIISEGGTITIRRAKGLEESKIL